MKCCVIGIGTFGYNVALTLMHHGVKVMAIDSDIVAIEKIQDMVTDALCIKVIDEESLRSAQVENTDIVIVAIGSDFADTVMISALLKRRLMVPMVVCRSSNNQHKEILELIGVDYVILPEQEAGIRLADTLSINYRNYNRITEMFSVTSFKVYRKWIGKKKEDIVLLQNKSITILGLRRGEDIIALEDDYLFKVDDNLVLFGSNEDLEEIIQLTRIV